MAGATNYNIRGLKQFFSLDTKGCICHLVKWQIHPFISKETSYFARGLIVHTFREKVAVIKKTFLLTAYYSFALQACIKNTYFKHTIRLSTKVFLPGRLREIVKQMLVKYFKILHQHWFNA